MMAVEQEYDELNMAIKMFQDTMMRVRYSGIPVIVAPHGMTLGGGCEMSMHADKVVAAAETLYRIGRIWRWRNSWWWWFERNGIARF